MDKAPLFYIKSGTTEPRIKGHEIHTPGGGLICIPQTSGRGIPPVARARVACCRACVDDAKRRRDTDSKRAKRPRHATSERSERVCVAARNCYERAFARVTNEPHGEREARAHPSCDSRSSRLVRSTTPEHATPRAGRSSVVLDELPSDLRRCRFRVRERRSRRRSVGGATDRRRLVVAVVRSVYWFIFSMTDA